MPSHHSLIEQTAELSHAVQAALQSERPDEADQLLQQLIDISGLAPDHEDLLPLRVTIDIQRGRARDALCMLNNLGEDRAPALKAVCLHTLGDPLWHGIASTVEETTTDPNARAAMRHLLGMEMVEETPVSMPVES
jgi:predicted Zn-dependent protease